MRIAQLKRSRKLTSKDIKTINFSLKIEKNGYKVLQYLSAFVFIWFALLKLTQLDQTDLLIPLASTFMREDQARIILGIYELILGLSLMYRPWVYTALKLLAVYLFMNFLPFVFMSEHCFVELPFVLSTQGKVIVLHLALVMGSIVIAGRQHIHIIELKG